MFPASDLVHPFEAVLRERTGPMRLDGRPLERPDVLAVLGRVCAVLGVRQPQVYVSELPGHAHAPGAVRIGSQSLTELASDELEALLAHVCGHLLLPVHAGELSADRVAALYHGSADIITRVIFSEVHSGPSAEGPAIRIREIHAWTATASFARLAALVPLA